MSEIVIYQSSDGVTKIDTKLEDETVWLTQQQMAELLQSSRTNVVEHIGHIYDEGELDETATCRNFRQVRTEGKRDVAREIPHYNLDMIISLGYRINSALATQFRRWATERLREYITQGFSMNDEFLKNNGGGAYWKKLLARIRDVRSSEKIMYRQVLDLYATAVDYNSKALESVKFFKIVQNKFHYAINKQTAAEVIFDRADANKDFMGLTVFAGDLPVLEEVWIAKNYLSVDELEKLNRLVSVYFDLAELRAIQHVPMKMSDYIAELDKLMTGYGEGVLTGAGKISHQRAMAKAEREYRKYQTATLSAPERDYLESLKSIEKKNKSVVKNTTKGSKK
ncbi:MAG: virulence RhuM family protein [Candidatus Nomurabacteria bacterium]|jgi:hypothetical protein|nr:virulence RhuM family protein [Candidatus Nomurabacteria bacterium]